MTGGEVHAVGEPQRGGIKPTPSKCVWLRISDISTRYETTCGWDQFEYADGCFALYDYCPFCGKEMEIREKL